ncbi:PREDICTED: uncharacterized protein LOC107354921 isoform X2 [Acropora digitifera]|uniref:uncharacterized protein LOC107354921 isoform X2 n=1 Tax=Acropora digitifera TaxID=70779 RepID=UPI00077ACB96|nr:PREDICTED: uncharacterized protein LOC107354921 isoform X2 [Acropora digitifera]
MAYFLGFALLGWSFRLIFAVEAAPCKYNKNNVESEAGLDREYSFTNRGESAWGHGSGEERNSISPVLLTVLVTLILAVLYQCMRFLRQVAMALEGHYEATYEGQSNSSDAIISIMEDQSGNYRNSDTYQWNQMVTEQGAYASKPLVTLVNDLSDFVEKIFQRLDTSVQGAGHYEVIANYFGFDVFEIRSRFEKCVGGPSRAMIEAIVVRHPEFTVEKFARVVEEKARRKDVAGLLRKYDRDSQKGDYDAMFEGQSSQPENSGDPIIQICVEDSSGHCKESGANASKPLESLSNDFSDFVEKIFRRLDTRIEGAGHYEVIANYFGFDVFDIRSRFEKSDGGPSRAMIEAIVVRHPELTVEKFARVVEEKARRKDVAHLLRAYDRHVLKKSV